MRLGPVVLVLMTSWLGWTGLVALIGFLAGLTGHGWSVGIGTAAMFLAGFALAHAGFWTEVGGVRQLLAKVLLDVHKEAADPGPHARGKSSSAVPGAQRSPEGSCH